MNPGVQAVAWVDTFSPYYICIKPFCPCWENIRSNKVYRNVRVLRQPLTTHCHAAETADFCCCFLPWVFRGKTAQRALTHVIWKYCDSQEIGLMSEETTVAVSFLLFFKKQFWSFKPYEKQSLLNIPLWGCVLMQHFSCLWSQRMHSSSLGLLTSAVTGVSSFLRPIPQASKNLCDKGQRMEPFLQKAGPVPYSATIALWLQRANNCLKRKNEFMAYVTDSPGMGQLRLWLDSGVKPVPRACFWSSLNLPSSVLVSVLALFVESWQQKLYPQFPLRILFLSQNFRSWYAWHLWFDLGQVIASGGMQYAGLLTISTQNTWPERTGISPIAI